jgi:hypothetical protein
MVAGFIVGIALVLVGLALMAHLSYTNLKQTPDPVCPEDPTYLNDSGKLGPINDCPLPFCFFQASVIANHETWIVAFLLGGAAVLSLSLYVGY